MLRAVACCTRACVKFKSSGTVLGPNSLMKVYTSSTVQLDLNLERISRVVMHAHAMHVISLAFSSASTRKFICLKNTHG